jgi:hypothetical protein
MAGLDPAISVLVADHRVDPRVEPEDGDDEEIKGRSWISAFAGMTMERAFAGMTSEGHAPAHTSPRSPLFVTPAEAGVQLWAVRSLSHIMAGLDPAISSQIVNRSPG